MLSVDTVATFLLERALIDVSAIIDSDLTIGSVARRNRNLRIEGPSGTGLFLKQAEEAGEAGQETLRREAAFHRFCAAEPGVADVSRLVPRLVQGGDLESVLVFELISNAISPRMLLEAGDHAVAQAMRETRAGPRDDTPEPSLRGLGPGPSTRVALPVPTLGDDTQPAGDLDAGHP